MSAEVDLIAAHNGPLMPRKQWQPRPSQPCWRAISSRHRRLTLLQEATDATARRRAEPRLPSWRDMCGSDTRAPTATAARHSWRPRRCSGVPALWAPLAAISRSLRRGWTPRRRTRRSRTVVSHCVLARPSSAWSNCPPAHSPSECIACGPTLWAVGQAPCSATTMTREPPQCGQPRQDIFSGLSLSYYQTRDDRRCWLMVTVTGDRRVRGHQSHCGLTPERLFMLYPKCRMAVSR